MVVEFNVNKACEYFGIGKKSVGRPMTQEELVRTLKQSSEAALKKLREKYDVDAYVPKKAEPKPQFILKSIEKPTLLTRLKRIPYVLANIIKHIR